MNAGIAFHTAPRGRCIDSAQRLLKAVIVSPPQTGSGVINGHPPSHIPSRIAHLCYLPEEAKNDASCCKGSQRDAVAQGVGGLHQNIERDLQRQTSRLSGGQRGAEGSPRPRMLFAQDLLSAADGLEPEAGPSRHLHPNLKVTSPLQTPPFP